MAGRGDVRALLAACAILAATVGCYTPLPRGSLRWGRGSIEKGDIAFLQIGETRREQILLRLGPPEIALDGEKLLLYGWGVDAGGILLGSFGSIPIVEECALVLEFDGGGTLRGFARFQGESGVGAPDGAAQKLARWRHGGESWPRLWVAEGDPYPELWAQLGDPTRPGGVRVNLGEFRDGRPGGQDGTALGKPYEVHPLGSVQARATRPVSDLVKAAVGRELERLGARQAESDAELEIDGRIDSFKVGPYGVTFAVTVVAASRETGRSLRRSYAVSRRGSDKTTYDSGAGARWALLQLQRLVGSDRALAALLREQGR